MGDTLDWWLLDGDWYDRKQQRALRDLERTSARAHSANRSLQRQVEQNQASLTRRVDQLERALRAVVELEDVREELIEHVPAALVRRHARSVVMAVSGLGGLPAASTTSEPPSDVSGYWLAPAACWAASLPQGAPDHAMLETARRRDPVRADLFLVALSVITDRPIDLTAAIDRLLSGPMQVSDWQRELWVAIAKGRFGSAVRSSLIDALRHAAADVTREQLSVAVLATSAAATPVESGHRLAALAQSLVAPPLTSESEESTVGGDDVAHGAERNDRLAELLAVIVDEGAPGEVAVLDSMTDIRRVLAEDAAMRPPERRVIDQMVEGPVELLLADLVAGDADLRHVAVDVFGEDIAAWAEELHAVAGSASAPTTMVDVFGQSVEISAGGVKDSTWAGYVDDAHPIEPMPSLPPFGIAGVLTLVFGLLLVAVGVSIGFVVALVGAGLAAWGGWTYWQQRESARRSVERRNNSRLRSEQQIEEATRRIRAETADFNAATSSLDASLERIVDRVRTREERATT